MDKYPRTGDPLTSPARTYPPSVSTHARQMLHCDLFKIMGLLLFNIMTIAYQANEINHLGVLSSECSCCGAVSCGAATGVASMSVTDCDPGKLI